MVLRKLVRQASAGLLGPVVVWCVLLAFPQPLFAYSLEEGRLSLYSDRPFSDPHARRLLHEIERRISTSPLDDHRPHAIFIANTRWRRGLVFLTANGARAVNWEPITSNVFIGRSDVDLDRVFSASGEAADPPRTLAYYAAHEITHSFTARKRGPARLWNKLFRSWVREGYADYVGMGGHIDLDELYRRYTADGAKGDPYLPYRLLCAYFLDREGWSLESLLESKLTAAEAEARMRQGMSGLRTRPRPWAG